MINIRATDNRIIYDGSLSESEILMQFIHSTDIEVLKEILHHIVVTYGVPQNSCYEYSYIYNLNIPDYTDY